MTGTLDKSISFHFTGEMMISDSALPELHGNFIKMKIHEVLVGPGILHS